MKESKRKRMPIETIATVKIPPFQANEPLVTVSTVTQFHKNEFERDILFSLSHSVVMRILKRL